MLIILSMPVITELAHVLKIIVSKLDGHNYAIRGTASLILQGLDMKAIDVDIVCDEVAALKCNDLFKEYIITPVSFSESSKFKSYFGKFSINDIEIEIMGNWQIKKSNGEWSKIYDGSGSLLITYADIDIPVTTVAQELAMFADMGRWNAFHKIKRQAKEMSLIEDKKKQEKDTNQLTLF